MWAEFVVLFDMEVRQMNGLVGKLEDGNIWFPICVFCINLVFC
jgi:hypothetical protein